MPRHRRPRPVSLLAMLVVNSGLACGGLGLSVMIFSLIPLAAAAIALPLNFFAFAFYEDRLSGAGYLRLVGVLYFAILLVLTAGLICYHWIT